MSYFDYVGKEWEKKPYIAAALSPFDPFLLAHVASPAPTAT